MTSLHYKETNSIVVLTYQTVLFTLLLLKSSGENKLGEFKSDQTYFVE